MINQPKSVSSMVIDPSLKKVTRCSFKSLELEGINLSDELMNDARLLDSEEITREEFIRRAIARAQERSIIVTVTCLRHMIC